jgi:hypothetical protein
LTARRPIRCDCCGTVVCAHHEGDRVVIRQRKHGRDHYAVVLVDKTTEQVEDSKKKSSLSSEG